MAEFRDLTPQEQLTACLTCGVPVVDQGLHVRWHQSQGDPQPIPQGGHNDPGPMPERG